MSDGKIVGPAGPAYGQGPMPAQAVVPLRAKISTGVQIISGAQIQLTPLGPGVGVAGTIWPQAEERTLVLGAIPEQSQLLPAAFPYTGFAPIAPGGTGQQVPLSLPCGLISDTGQRWGGSSAFGLIGACCILEYGSESVTNKVVFDWKVGSYNIPACKFARVSCLLWGDTGAWDALTQWPAKAAIVPGNLQGAHVPTVTGAGTIPAAGGTSFLVPNSARAVEVWSPLGTGVITMTGAGTAKRDYTTPLFVPGWSPIALSTDAGQGVNLSAPVDQSAVIQFYLEL